MGEAHDGDYDEDGHEVDPSDGLEAPEGPRGGIPESEVQPFPEGYRARILVHVHKIWDAHKISVSDCLRQKEDRAEREIGNDVVSLIETDGQRILFVTWLGVVARQGYVVGIDNQDRKITLVRGTSSRPGMYRDLPQDFHRAVILVPNTSEVLLRQSRAERSRLAVWLL